MNPFDPPAAPAPNGPPAAAGLLPEPVARVVRLLESPRCQQLRANGPDRVFYIDTDTGLVRLPEDHFDDATYHCFVEHLIRCCDVGDHHGLDDAPTPFVEGSFLRDRIAVDGSIHVATKMTTRAQPAVTVRKQPDDKITLNQMVDQCMLDHRMRLFLELSVRARLNMMISGGSGAGKTTLARALSLHIDPAQRVNTAEEIDELALYQHLPDTVSMTTWKRHDANGNLVGEVTLEQLVREALRMRPDRIWVGETRGKEAYALVKACNSGHDGSATTVHGDNGQQAIKQLVSYVMESHLTEQAAADQVARAFHIVVQISKTTPSTRVIAEIVELEPVREGAEQRRNPLFGVDFNKGTFEVMGRPTNRMIESARRYGVDILAPFDRPEVDPGYRAQSDIRPRLDPNLPAGPAPAPASAPPAEPGHPGHPVPPAAGQGPQGPEWFQGATRGF